MTDRGRPGNEEDVGSALKQPCQRDLHWRGLQRCCRRIELPRLQRRKTSEREVGHAGDALSGQIVDELVVDPLGDVVEVLNAGNQSE